LHPFVPTNTSLIDYYAKRAGEYERIYQKPERHADLAALKKLCAQSLAGHDVLEIACGTGYWTQPVSQTAKSIVATDINDEVLQIARAKEYRCAVSFQQADVFNLGALAENNFTAGMAMHWWSHLRKSEIQKFLDGFHQVFRPGALLIFMDNRFVAGSSTPISRTDGEGNTYQLRRLQDGTEHEVLKNFPSEIELKNILAGSATEIRWTELPYYWLLTYRLK
jgi:demethylmenaquinone methyltransferase/2-methoxy-6-polyprenyl-1,4-benzoquinol methylase